MRCIIIGYLVHLLYFLSGDSFVYKKNINTFINYFRIYGKNNNHNINATSKTITGIDYRYDNTTRNDESELMSIKKHMQQLHVLKLLQDNNIPIYTKLQIIDNYSQWFAFNKEYMYNLYRGGLINDFDFDF